MVSPSDSKQLPGLDYTDGQLFFIVFEQVRRENIMILKLCALHIHIRYGVPSNTLLEFSHKTFTVQTYSGEVLTHCKGMN